MPDLALAHLAHYRPLFAPLSNGQWIQVAHGILFFFETTRLRGYASCLRSKLTGLGVRVLAGACVLLVDSCGSPKTGPGVTPAIRLS
jgi:hypothetical protein